MKIDHPETGEEIEVFTAEEVETQKTEALATNTKEWEEKHNATTTEIEKLRSINADQTSNIKRLKDMSDEEKEKLSAEQIENRKIAEEALEGQEALKKQIEARDASDVATKKETLIKAVVGEDKDLREKLEAKIATISADVPLEERIASAATLAGIGSSANPTNPLATPQGVGMPPTQMKTQEEKGQFMASDRGKSAASRLGIIEKKEE